MPSIWNTEFILRYPNWEDRARIEKEILKGSYRDVIQRSRELVIKQTPPNRGSRREISIYLGDCFLKAIG